MLRLRLRLLLLLLLLFLLLLLLLLTVLELGLLLLLLPVLVLGSPTNKPADNLRSLHWRRSSLAYPLFHSGSIVFHAV